MALTLNERIKSHPMILNIFKFTTHFSRDDKNTIAANNFDYDT